MLVAWRGLTPAITTLYCRTMCNQLLQPRDNRHAAHHMSRCLFRAFQLTSLTVLLFWLSACSTQPLLSDVQTSTDTFEPTADGDPLTISYRVGRDAEVSVYLLDEAGQRFDLRDRALRSADSDPYNLSFDGTIPTDDPSIRRRLLPSGEYTVFVEAQAEDGTTASEQTPMTVNGSDVPLPTIENLVVSPDTISPNADAIADVTEITYRLPVSATVDISITTPANETIPLVIRSEEGPALQWHVWDGKRPNGALLDNGVYTYTISAEDRFGNLVEQTGQITLEQVGQPVATITYANIAPEQLMLGETLTVTMRVKNTGTVPIRTYGPPSGYTYTTDDVFSSIEDGQYTSEAGGFWRVGMDWDANSGGGPKRYPFRWAISPRPPEQWHIPGEEDWLMPGEEAEIIGRVVVLQRETQMGFYVGLIQDGVGFFQDRSGRTIVEVGF